MQPTMCSRCGKNVAVIFITKMENGTTKNEGLCLKCAREMGIKPIDDMMKKMGINDEDLDNLTTEMMSAFGGAEGLEGLMNQPQSEDGDGEEELILLYTTAITAGHRGFICSWEEETGALGIQLTAYPLFTFYESGAVQVGWSHNQGKGGAFWPYDLYRYDAVLDAYVDVGSVDAWDASLTLEGFPREADQSGTGFVYYIETSGSITWNEPLDASIYEAWRYPYVRDGQELQPEYLALTEENIQRLLLN